MGTMKVAILRYNDYKYDPLFIVSGEKDYYKAARTAKMSSAKFAVCPIFPSMFSDLPHHPRQQYVMRKGEPITHYREYLRKADDAELLLRTKDVDVAGVDRFKFFDSSLKKDTAAFSPTIVAPTPPPPLQVIKAPVKKRNRKIQTQYRESSAQTIPWQPDFVVMDNGDPELLMLDFLKWGSGLPAGMHEVRLIERARMKRAWEQSMPPVTDAASLEKRREIIEAMETDEWAFREQEIQDIQDLRLELLKQMLNELLQKSKGRMERKMDVFCKTRLAEKEEKIKRLHHDTERELRKLRMQSRGVATRYRKTNIVDEHADRKSELYGPLIRHGEHPKRWHMVIDDHAKKYKAQYLGVEAISTLPTWLDQMVKAKEPPNLKLPGTRLCIRETKWTTPVLKQLHEELKNLRKEDKRLCTLMVRVAKEPSEVETPQIVDFDDWEEEVYQASVLIESVLRGRASQMLIFEGRDRCRELIQELRSTHALQEEDKIKKFNERLEVKSQQREHVMCSKNIHLLQETLNKFSGTVVGTLIDFLNKELRRLMEERRAHAMCLLFEREKYAREAAEAGRRQAEMRRRKEHDEVFRQVVKVHQDTVDLYLQDIITEGVEFASEAESRIYIKNLAAKIDDEAYATADSMSYHAKEELIAELVHNFLLPEVQKQIIRANIKKKQHTYLKVAHDTIYSHSEELPKPKPKQKPRAAAKSKPAPPQRSAPARSLEKAVPIIGFDDFILAETKAPVDINVIYSETGKTRANSETSSVMEPFKEKENSKKSQLSIATGMDDTEEFEFRHFSNRMTDKGTKLDLETLHLSTEIQSILTEQTETISTTDDPPRSVLEEQPTETIISEENQSAISEDVKQAKE